MGNLEKMRAAVGGKLKQKPRDLLFGQAATAPRPPKEGKPPEQRKLPEDKIPNLYPIRLQTPINKEQEILLTSVALKLRKGGGELINKGAVVRCLLNLLEDMHLADADSVTTEHELQNLFREKLFRK